MCNVQFLLFSAVIVGEKYLPIWYCCTATAMLLHLFALDFWWWWWWWWLTCISPYRNSPKYN